MIAGTYDDMQGGICYGGIAHAGPPRFQRRMWFDGVDDRVVCAVANMPTGGAARTLCGWIWMYDSTNRHVLISFPREPAKQGFGLMMALVSGVFYVFSDSKNASNNITVGVGERPALKTWGHLAFTLKTNAWKYYLNGTYIKGGTFAVPINTEPTEVEIGSRVEILYRSRGIHRDVRVYARDLSADEVTQVYQGQTDVGGCVLRLAGGGHTDADWINLDGSPVNNGTVSGSPNPAYIRDDGKIIVNGVVMNP